MPPVIAQPLPYTLLALGRYAKIMGINPAHFMRATAANVNPQVFPIEGCSALWPRHSWQDANRTSHEELADAIYGVEREIASFLGYFPAPMWVSEEEHQYPRPYDPTTFNGMTDIRGLYKTNHVGYGKVIAGGRRAVVGVGTATVAAATLVYSDDDTDGAYETATITLPTTHTTACGHKVYIQGMGGAQEWEIRPVQSVVLSGGNVIIVADAWLFINPDLLAAYPTDAGFSAIEISSTANFVTQVDVYFEYNDNSQASSEMFYYEATCAVCGGSGCDVCYSYSQTGCLHLRDRDLGIVSVVPGTYSQVNSKWESAAWDSCLEPMRIKLWYYGGDISEEYKRGTVCDPLSTYLAQAIAWMATARLQRGLCECDKTREFSEYLRTDLALSGSEGTYLTPEQILLNPFGTHRGEVMAYKRLARLQNKRPHVALI